MYSIFEKLCKQNGITPYRVSKDTGISTATLSDWKTGKSHPKADKVQKIADYFGVTTHYLRTGEKEPIVMEFSKSTLMGALDKVMESAINRESQELIDKYFSLDRDDRDEIMALIDIKLGKYREKESEGSV